MSLATHTNDAKAPPAPESRQRAPTLEAMEYELAIDMDAVHREGFASAIRQTVEGLGGEYLFDLPASALSEGVQRIAVIRRTTGDKSDMLLLAKLSEDGESISISEPDEETEGVADFARAFVNLLRQF